MRTEIPDTGLLLPKDWFADAKEVEIHRDEDKIVIIPVSGPDPIFDLGQRPVTDEITDASENHDHYLTKQ